jgi:hypothetical protein
MNEDITIYRDFPIVNGYAQVAPNREAEKTKHTPTELLAVVTGVLTRLSQPNTNPTTGRKFGSQEFVRVEGQTFSVSL